jgi:LPS-assembly lipoprotein
MLAVAGLAGCGFQPVYGTQGTTYAAQEVVAQIEIAPIKDRVGQQLRNELIRLLTPGGEPANANYLMTINLRINERDVFTRDNREINRKSVLVEASYRVIDKATYNTGDPAVKPVVVYENKAFAEASYNRFESEFANIRARIDAENLAAREVADFIRNQIAAAVVAGRL